MSAHNHAEHVAGCFWCELSREEAMTDRRCDHNTSSTPIHNPTFTGECLVYEICDACHDIATTREHQHEEGDN